MLDGEGFILKAGFGDGTRITAKGTNSFPKNYSEVKWEFEQVFSLGQRV